jgi:hypothetical protein
MQESLQLLELLEKIAALETPRLRAEHVAFIFMKRRIQSLMRRAHLGYNYAMENDPSRLLDEVVSDELIVARLGRIFKDMPVYTPCPVQEYSASHSPEPVSSHGINP